MSWLRDVFARRPAAPRVSPPGSGERSGARRPTGPEPLTTLNLERFLRTHPRAVVDVWAPWCRPCRAFAPVFLEASKRWGEEVGFGKLHAEHEASLAGRFGVRSIPSLLFFRDGEMVRREVGALTPDRLDQRLRKVFRDLP